MTKLWANGEAVDNIARFIDDHAYQHSISNSPYGHVCSAECLSRAVLARVDSYLTPPEV